MDKAFEFCIVEERKRGEEGTATLRVCALFSEISICRPDVFFGGCCCWEIGREEEEGELEGSTCMSFAMETIAVTTSVVNISSDSTRNQREKSVDNFRRELLESLRRRQLVLRSAAESNHSSSSRRDRARKCIQDDLQRRSN